MRKVKILFIMCILGCMFVGCQKDTVQYINPTEAPNSGNEQEFDFEDDEELEDSQEYEEDVQPSKSPTEKYKHFDADEGWKELTGYEYAVQVDDVLYIPGITAEEFIDKVETSSIEYTYEYNGNRLVSRHEKVEINICRDGSNWFSVVVCNFEEETKSLSEALLFKIIPSDKALSFSRFIDGRSYEEILQMSYTDVQKLAEEKFSGVAREKKTNSGDENISLAVNARLAVKVDVAHTLIDTSRAYVFNVNKDSGKVSGVSQGQAVGIDIMTYGLRYTPPEPKPIKSFSEMSEDDIELLNNKAMNVFEYYNYYNIVDSVSYLQKEEEDSEYVSYVIIIKNDVGGLSKNIAICTFKGLGRMYDGQISYEDYDISYPYEYISYEEYVENLSPEFILEMKAKE